MADHKPENIHDHMRHNIQVNSTLLNAITERPASGSNVFMIADLTHIHKHYGFAINDWQSIVVFSSVVVCMFLLMVLCVSLTLCQENHTTLPKYITLETRETPVEAPEENEETPLSIGETHAGVISQQPQGGIYNPKFVEDSGRRLDVSYIGIDVPVVQDNTPV